MRMIILLSILLFACKAVEQRGFDPRYEMIENYINATDKRDGFEPYSVSNLDNINLEISASAEWIFSTLSQTKLNETINSIVSSNEFKEVENYVLFNEERTYCLEVNDVLKPSSNGSDVLNSLNLVSSIIDKKLFSQNKKIYNVILYSGENEIHLINTYFDNRYRGQIGCTNRNIIPLRVLEKAFSKEAKYHNEIGITKNSYKYTINLPLVFEGKYIADISSSFFY